MPRLSLARHYNALLRRADLPRSGSTIFAARKQHGSWNRVSNWSSSTSGHAHIGVTATVYAHVRPRQRDAIDLLGRTLGNLADSSVEPDDGDNPPLCAAPVR